MQARLGASQFRRVRRFAQDPLLVIVFIVISVFVLLAVLLPLAATTSLSVSEEGLPLFQRYIGDPTYQTIITNTIVMGLLVAALGTTVGFVFAFVQVKLDVPFKRFMHFVALLPVISPPFAVATAMIVLFGRNGMISRGIFGVRYDIYGLDGLTSVLALSFFTIAYLNLRGMMMALDPALDEASTSLGAGKWRTFRKVTLPMLAPGIASSFLLLFVEAIADLGNPLVLGGNYEVLATRIYITIVGLYDPVGAAVLCLILLVPSLTVFLVQRYWISRASVVSVTGKPAGKPQTIRQPLVRWGLFGVVMFICILIVLLYATIILGAFVKVPGVNETLTLEHFDFVINGLGRKAMEDTTRL
jgi:iron(III) transport system permease protein